MWPGLIAVAGGAAVLTAGLERSYLATVTNGPRWGFDVVLLTMVLGVLAATRVRRARRPGRGRRGPARGFGAGTVAGLLALVAVAAGTAAAYLPLRAAYLAEPDRFPVVANLGDGDLLVPFDVFLVVLIWALPWPVLGAALGARTGTAGRSTRHATSGSSCSTWPPPTCPRTGPRGAPRCGPNSRRSTRRPSAAGSPSAGCGPRCGPGCRSGAWVLAAGVAVVVAGGSFAASRWSLAHDQGGILGFWMSVPSALLLAVALATAWRNRSFGAGMRAGALAGLAALVAVLAVSIPEAVVWAHQRAGYLSTGDAVPPTWQSAVLDVLRPEFLVGMIVFWTRVQPAARPSARRSDAGAGAPLATSPRFECPKAPGVGFLAARFNAAHGGIIDCHKNIKQQVCGSTQRIRPLFITLRICRVSPLR